MKFLIILDKYYPILEANALCVNNIVKHLKPSSVTVLCRVNDIKLAGHYYINENTDVIALYHKSSQPFSNLSIFKKMLYIVRHTVQVLFSPLPEAEFVEKLYTKAEELLHSNQYSLVISVLNPIEAVEAGNRLKVNNSDILFLIYDLDSASNCSVGIIESFFKHRYYKKVYQWERKVFQNADLIIHLENHKKHFRMRQYEEYRSKTLYQGIPLLDIYDNGFNKNNGNYCNTQSGEETYNLIYAGSFHHRLREPNVMFDIFIPIIEMDRRIKYRIFTKGHYFEWLKNNYTSENIIISEYVNQNTLNTFIEKATALISLGNKKTDMFPSKIVSYCASLKPIIHIYQNNNDPVIGFLRKYPNSLLLDGNESPEINAQKVLRFIRNGMKIIHSDEFLKLHINYTGKFCAMEISKFLKEKYRGN